MKTIRKASEAKLIYDPMRREMLRLLCKEPMTQTQLATALGLRGPTVGYHLSALKSNGFVSIAGQEVGKHGVAETYYESTAQLFFVEGKNMPLEIKRYFMPIVIERARGILGCAAMTNKGFYLQSDTMEKFALSLADNISRIAINYEVPVTDLDPEICVIRLYSEALESTLESGFNELRKTLTPR